MKIIENVILNEFSKYSKKIIILNLVFIIFKLVINMEVPYCSNNKMIVYLVYILYIIILNNT